MKKYRKITRAQHSALVSAILIGLMSITPYAAANESEYLATESLDYDGITRIILSPASLFISFTDSNSICTLSSSSTITLYL